MLQVTNCLSVIMLLVVCLDDTVLVLVLMIMSHRHRHHHGSSVTTALVVAVTFY